MDSYLSRAYALVSWREVRRVGKFVFCRRGTGETGWWHDCRKRRDYGGNPMDRHGDDGKLRCRTCKSVWTPPAPERREG